MNIEYNCYKEKGKLIVKNRDLLNAEIDTLQEGIDYVLCIKKKKRMRSNGQNRYYWAIVVPNVLLGLRDAGFNEIRTKDDAHDIIKVKFLRYDIQNIMGEHIESFKSTSELSTQEFADFIAEVQIWGAEFLNISIPSPNDDLEIEFI